MIEHYLRDDGCGMVYDSELVSKPDFDLGECSWWRERGRLLGNTGGRGTVYFVASDEGQWALRHYRRGGLIGRWFDDHFIWLGENRVRSFHEWQLLARLRDMDLPVPRPVAAIYKRDGLAYTAELLTVRIAGARPLSQRMNDGAVDASHWQAMGRCIRRFHDAGSYHADLTGHNILLDDKGDMHLLDFDRGDIRAGGAWKASNLKRLHRSLRKISVQDENINASEADWRSLIDAYRG
ncbi:MAG: 3-deoxy-D-manno-octulosonic acid kinase [Gammaproteobacteria bacterium]|nr:3-deoxy-D-manno-octulosonic acid kinase [Gammaproteobacteria bacterium]